MLKPVMFVLALMMAAPFTVQAAEITLVPAVTLHIGDRDSYGRYWDGGRWRDYVWWNKQYQWRERGWRLHRAVAPHCSGPAAGHWRSDQERGHHR